MKKSEFKAIIKESVREVLAEAKDVVKTEKTIKLKKFIDWMHKNRYVFGDNRSWHSTGSASEILTRKGWQNPKKKGIVYNWVKGKGATQPVALFRTGGFDQQKKSFMIILSPLKK
jgi:hypothetical protein